MSRTPKRKTTAKARDTEITGLPPYLARMSLSTLPFDFAWDPIIRDTLLDPDDERDMRLAAQLSELRDEGVFAIGLAVAEWIVARVASVAPARDVHDALHRIEAMWALCFELRYARLTEPPIFTGKALAKAEEPLWVSRRLLYWGYSAAIDGDELQGDVLSHILLARQVMGPHKGFSTWLTEAIKKAKKHYAPAKNETEDDQLTWRPVPPEFFRPDFTWKSTADAKARVDRFLAGLDPAANPYLRDAKDMVKAGFNGTPYGR